MSIAVRIPPCMRALTNAMDAVFARGATVAEVIDDLEKMFPGVRARLVDGGRLQPFVSVYVGEEDIRFLDGLDTRVQGGDSISFVPMIAGG